MGALEALERWLGKPALGKAVKGRDGRGNGPLHLATLNGHTAAVAWLLQRGASPGAKNKAGRTPLHVAEAAGLPDLRALLKAPGKGRSSSFHSSPVLHVAMLDSGRQDVAPPLRLHLRPVLATQLPTL